VDGDRWPGWTGQAWRGTRRADCDCCRYPNPIDQPTPVPDIAPSLVFCASLSGFLLICPACPSSFPSSPFTLHTIVNQQRSWRDIDCSKHRFTSGIDIEIKTTVLSHPLVPLGTVFWPCWILSLSRPSLQTHTDTFTSQARLASRTFTTTRCASRHSSHWLQHRCWLSLLPNNNNNKIRTHH
jgi:hypothetical protein